MPRTRDAGNRTSAQRGAVHDGGVHFISAFAGKDRALARIEEWIVFQNVNGGFHGVECRAALVQHLGACLGRGLQAGAIALVALGAQLRALDNARASVNDESPVMRGLLRVGGKGEDGCEGCEE